MIVEEYEEVIVKKRYIAEDGTAFHTDYACQQHEFLEKNRKAGNVVYAVVHSYDHRRHLEIFSTEELAEKSIENCEEKFNIIEVVIDHRFIR